MMGFTKLSKRGTLMGLRSHAQQLITVNKTTERDRNFKQTFYRSQKDTESANLYEHMNKKSMKEATEKNRGTEI